MCTVSGLVIDAFGELRDQLDSVNENMESSCFICRIGKEYFNAVPRGFDTHIAKEHSPANYM
jgi:ryanodine receptor 2